ncbi:hypothetical protein [Halobaculum sp. EA56]|uniref:hypothetical protein n=1 Tax=Halobaculum sp. EA56 TaxID=3421648 RepID=UPI003EBCDDD5
MVSFLTRLSDGWDRAMRAPLLALVPIAFAVMNTEKIRRVATFDGAHVGMTFGYPMPVVTTWQFVSVPNTGVNAYTGVPIEALPFALLTVPLVVLAQTLLTAGYFGSLRDVLTGSSPTFWRHCRAYFLPFLLLTVAPLLVLLPIGLGMVGSVAAGSGAGAAALFLVLVPVYLLLGYLFWATPYLVVLRDSGLLEAARASYDLAMDVGPYARYTGGYVLFVAGLSVVATALVVNVPIVGLVAGILGGGLLGVTVNVATMRFVAEIDPETNLGVDRDTDDLS